MQGGRTDGRTEWADGLSEANIPPPQQLRCAGAGVGVGVGVVIITKSRFTIFRDYFNKNLQTLDFTAEDISMRATLLYYIDAVVTKSSEKSFARCLIRSLPFPKWELYYHAKRSANFQIGIACH